MCKFFIFLFHFFFFGYEAQPFGTVRCKMGCRTLILGFMINKGSPFTSFPPAPSTLPPLLSLPITAVLPVQSRLFFLSAVQQQLTQNITSRTHKTHCKSRQITHPKHNSNTPQTLTPNTHTKDTNTKHTQNLHVSPPPSSVNFLFSPSFLTLLSFQFLTISFPFSDFFSTSLVLFCFSPPLTLGAV